MSPLPCSQQLSVRHRVCRRLLLLSALPIGVFTPWISVEADRQERPASFQVARNDSIAAHSLANQIAALSPRVDRDEANLLAQCAYATASQLRKQYSMFGTPIFNNFLVRWGVRKRGYCFQWAEDLLIALDALKLTSLELHWGEANPGNWRENNCIVVTAKGQPFNRGIILDCWRQLGHLRCGPVLSDADPYVENSAYARFVRARSATPANRHFALQTRREAKEKKDD